MHLNGGTHSALVHIITICKCPSVEGAQPQEEEEEVAELAIGMQKTIWFRLLRKNIQNRHRRRERPSSVTSVNG